MTRCRDGTWGSTQSGFILNCRSATFITRNRGFLQYISDDHGYVEEQPTTSGKQRFLLLGETTQPPTLRPRSASVSKPPVSNTCASTGVTAAFQCLSWGKWGMTTHSMTGRTGLKLRGDHPTTHSPLG